MPTFHALKIAAIECIAEDATALSLEVPPALTPFFAFHAGQYVTVRRKLATGEVQRTYSIVTPPGTDRLILGVRRQPQGLMSNDLGASLAVGDTLEVSTPLGRFRTDVHPDRRLSYVAFAAGSGITPILSLASDILARETESSFTLIYGNRCLASAMFIERIFALKNRYMTRFAVHFVMSREPQQAPYLNGRLNAEKVQQLAQHIPAIHAAQEFFVCGPGDMIEALQLALAAVNPTARIRFERFAGVARRTVDESPLSLGKQATPLATIEVLMDGRQRRFDMYESDDSVLAAAERAGLQLPFSCRAGICATCRARITAGAAQMRHNIALAPWETALGFVLCCQARPTTSHLELSFDHK